MTLNELYNKISNANDDLVSWLWGLDISIILILAAIGLIGFFLFFFDHSFSKKK